MRKTITTMLFIAAMAGQAGAQQVYRCGNSYSGTPCAGAVIVPASDTRSPGEARQAAAAAKVDAQRAAVFEKARLQREAQAPRAIVMEQPPAAAPAPQAAASKAKKSKKEAHQRKPEHFTAVSSAPVKKAKK